MSLKLVPGFYQKHGTFLVIAEILFMKLQSQLILEFKAKYYPKAMGLGLDIEYNIFFSFSTFMTLSFMSINLSKFLKMRTKIFYRKVSQGCN